MTDLSDLQSFSSAYNTKNHDVVITLVDVTLPCPLFTNTSLAPHLGPAFASEEQPHPPETRSTFSRSSKICCRSGLGWSAKLQRGLVGIAPATAREHLVELKMNSKYLYPFADIQSDALNPNEVIRSLKKSSEIQSRDLQVTGYNQ